MDPSPPEQFLSLSLHSSRKSYYPLLKQQLDTVREKERRLQLLIDNVPAMIAFVDKEERYVFVNRAYEKHYGRKRDEIIGAHVQTMMKEVYPKVKPYIDQALAGHRVTYEVRRDSPDGTRQYFDVSYVPDVGTDGVINGFYALSIDLTEKKQTEGILRNKDLLLREIGTQLKIGGWEYDPATGQGTWTDEVARVYDLNPDDEANVEIGLSYFHGDSRRRLENAVRNANEKGEAFDLELEIISAKGVHKWVRSVGVPQIKNGRVTLVRGSFQDITERVQNEQARLASEERFRLLVESAPDAVFVQAMGQFAYANSAAAALFGATNSDDLIGLNVLDHVRSDYRAVEAERIRLVNEKRAPVPSIHEVYLRMDGTDVHAEVSAIPLEFQGKPGALVFARDISARLAAEKEQQSLQEQLHQIQKLESVGRLAGGVAHDYNNFLSVIIGYTELSLMDLDPDAPIAQNLKQVLNAANRSQAVTHQLLAFARKETITPEVLDLNAVVEGILKMIRRLIGENIDLTWHPKAGLWPVKMDPSQIDQIIANLCVNARDAIPNVGRIIIETGNATIDDDFCTQHTDCSPGEYVMLKISDNGSGMDKETLSRIFEPFFTTKGVGKGTGLGLATVYGIIKQNKGVITVDSACGEGTTFSLFMPRYFGKVIDTHEPEKTNIPIGSGETILVVDDEGSILSLAKRLLERLSYVVLTAATPVEALRIATARSEEITLVITDVIMPEMNGRELIEQLKEINPALKYFYISGYTADIIAGSGVLDSDIPILQKPFSTEALARKVREVLSS